MSGHSAAACRSTDHLAACGTLVGVTAMKQRSVRSLAVGVAISGTLLMALFWSNQTAGNPSQEKSRLSVKDLKLKVSPNGRYFVDQDGKPFFYLGDTCWLLFQRLNREEVDEYLKDRAAKGFTVIQAYVLRGLGKQHPDGNSSLLGRDARSSTATRPAQRGVFQERGLRGQPGERTGPGDGPGDRQVVARHGPSGKSVRREERLRLRQIPGRALQEQRRDVVSGRRLRSGKIRRGLGGDGEGAEGRQRRQPARLLPRPGEHFVIHVVSQGGLARLQLDPIRASISARTVTRLSARTTR